MRFSTVLVGVFAAFAAAQSSDTAAATTTPAVATTSTTSVTAAQSSTLACLDKCEDGDIACTAKCVPVPNPNASQVNATNECVAACPQGSGSASDNTKYANCVATCISQNYYSSSGTPVQTTAAAAGGSGASDATATGTGTAATGTAKGTATGTAAEASGTGSDSSSTATGSGSSSASSTASGSATSSSPTGAADSLRVGTTAVGLFGLLAAVMAL